jgi:hypothetical protein
VGVEHEHPDSPRSGRKSPNWGGDFRWQKGSPLRQKAIDARNSSLPTNTLGHELPSFARFAGFTHFND